MATTARDTVEHVLQRLRIADGPVSGECLSRELSISRMAISKAVSHLREQGYDIVSTPRKGHWLKALTDRPLAREVQPLLKTESLGRVWIHEPSMESTNAVAMTMARENAPHGLVVVTDAQTRGRGRMGRQWLSPPGRGLTFSVVLRPNLPPERIPQLSLVAGVAIKRALTSLLPELAVGLKWPNDIWVGQKKLGGILCEMDAEIDRVHHVVVGVGINVTTRKEEFPEILRDQATSIREELGRSPGRPLLLATLLNALEDTVTQWLASEDLTPLLDEIRHNSPLLGRRISVDQLGKTLRGVAENVAPDGRLILRLEHGAHLLVHSGDIHILHAGSVP